jgi:hypothetical protein
MRFHAALLAAALAVVMLAPSASAAGPMGDVTRIRPLNDQAAALLADARQKSPTVRDLLKTLENGDVVAYLQVVPAREGAPSSTLRFVGASHAVRFVLVQVAECKTPCRKIELLGHELQHATDVAQAPWVTDDGRLQAMLALTGWVDAGSARGYETSTAMRAERLVRRDVQAFAAANQ